MSQKQSNLTNLLSELWNGKITLWKTYWGLSLIEMITFVSVQYLVNEDRNSVHALNTILYLLYSIFFLICVWRSANNYKGRRVWYYLAKLTAIIDVMFSTLTAIQYGGLA